jgi:hypothetical protein
VLVLSYGEFELLPVLAWNLVGNVSQVIPILSAIYDFPKA